MSRKAKPRPAPAAPAAAAPAAGAPAASKTALVLKFVVGVSTVLSLVFALRQSAIYLTDYRDRQRRVTELLAAAELQRGGRDYRAAWSSLRAAAAVGARGDTVQVARENLAMDWLDNAAGSEELTLGAIGDTVAPVLSRGALAARGARRGDLIAHLGWADFFRWRDGQFQLDPAARYRQALAADPGNVYAHAMLAHWLLWNGDSPAEANAHFAAALASGREGPYVRRLQFAAAGNAMNGAGERDMLRVANAMRTSNDSVDATVRDRLWSVYYSAFFTSRGTLEDQFDRIGAMGAPRNLLLTYRWLFATSRYPESDGVVYTYRLASLEAAAGDSAQALATYRAARAQTTRGDEQWRARIDSAIARLSRPR